AFLAAAIVAAFVLGIAPASALLPALAGAGVFFMHRDRAVLFAWEDRVLSLWGASDLCLGIFRQTFMDHPHALKRSLKSLAASLPENADFLVPPAPEILSHRAYFWTRTLLQDIRFSRAAALLFAAACVPASMAWAHARGGEWLWLMGAAPLAAVPPARDILARLSLGLWRRRRGRLAGSLPGPNAGSANRYADLDWSGFPPRQQAAIRTQILTGERRPAHSANPYLSRLRSMRIM